MSPPSGQRRCSPRSEEHTSELQSRQYLVCRLLLEKKKTTQQPSAPAQAGRQEHPPVYCAAAPAGARGEPRAARRARKAEWTRACVFFFFFNDAAPPEIYPFSLHDALPICGVWQARGQHGAVPRIRRRDARRKTAARSEEHTSELQSRQYLVCRLLLEQ